MAELISIPDILSLGGTVTVTFGFLIYLRLLLKDNRKERDASERRYGELLKDNTAARSADHESRNKETEALLQLYTSIQTFNQINGTRQEKCDRIREELKAEVTRIREISS